MELMPQVNVALPRHKFVTGATLLQLYLPESIRFIFIYRSYIYQRASAPYLFTEVKFT
jgi:hypothetical protein